MTIDKATIRTLATSAALRYNIDIPLVFAIIDAESSWDPESVNANDPSYGLMGIEPITAQTYGYIADWTNVSSEDIAKIKDPATNLDIGCHLLSDLLSRNDLWTSVEMYNVGESGYLNDGYRDSAYVSKVQILYYYYGGTS